MRVAITGATGLLGRNLLYEILKRHYKDDGLKIIVFGRKKSGKALLDRILEIIKFDGINYIFQKDSEYVEDEIKEKIFPIEYKIEEKKLDLKDEEIKFLRNSKIDYFFHLAALSDFRKVSSVRDKLYNVNVNGVKNILNLISELKVGEFIYTGTAYCYGKKKGIIKADYINTDGGFNNYYEETKLLGEINVREFCKMKKIKYKIHRPVGICGRLMEEKIGSISKYDTFYAWGKFFLREKIKSFVGDMKEIYKNKINMPIRVMCDVNGSLNSVPADYAAKLIWELSYRSHNGCSYNIANETEIINKEYLGIILDEIGIDGVKYVDKEPLDKNRSERLYYDSIGQIYTPYLMEKGVQFDIEDIKEFNNRIGLICPNMDEKNFRKLIKFAKSKYFGIVL